MLDRFTDVDLVLDRVSLSLGCGVGFALGQPHCWPGAMLNRYSSYMSCVEGCRPTLHGGLQNDALNWHEQEENQPKTNTNQLSF